jgi:D-alanine-D-alanine ligase
VSYRVIILHRPLKFTNPSLTVTVVTEEYIQRFESALQEAGFDARLVDVLDDIEDVLQTFDPRSTLIFNCCEGTDDDPNGYDPITGLLEKYGFGYTGASDPVLAWSHDKANMKARLVEHGIPTPKYAICHNGIPQAWDTFPALVKPANQHGSFGITRASVVDSPESLAAQVKDVHETWKKAALVEDFIDGMEIRVYMLGNDEIEVLPLYATYYDAMPDYHDHLFGYENKWGEESANALLTYALPPKLPDDLQALIVKAAVDGYRACEARDYGTVDIRVRDGIPYVLDVNQNPDISDGYSFADAAKAGGYDYPTLLAKIVRYAAERLPK